MICAEFYLAFCVESYLCWDYLWLPAFSLLDIVSTGFQLSPFSVSCRMRSEQGAVPPHSVQCFFSLYVRERDGIKGLQNATENNYFLNQQCVPFFSDVPLFMEGEL